MASNAEFNLKRLEKTTLPMDFVRAHSGEWDHQAWLEFCASLEDKGYTPIDLDQVGRSCWTRRSDRLLQSSIP